MTQTPAMIGIAKKNEADPLIPGRHEKGFLGNMFFSATAQKILQGVQCDVLVVHIGDKASDAE